MMELWEVAWKMFALQTVKLKVEDINIVIKLIINNLKNK